MLEEPEKKQSQPESNIDHTDLIPRRRFLNLAGAGILTIGFGSFAEGLVGGISEPLNRQIESLIFKPQGLVPELPFSALDSEKLIINSFRGTPAADSGTYRLTVDGEVNNPLSISMTDLQKFPLTSMIIRHVCVEGWSAVVHWGGVKLRDLLTITQPSTDVKYAYFYSADGYYESWDINSVMHPQTLLAYQKNGRSLTPEFGAPLRLASPVKLGYKLSKWVTRIQLVSQLDTKRGYWEDLGYEWYAGL